MPQAVTPQLSRGIPREVIGPESFARQKSRFDARHQLGQMWLDHLVVNPASFSFAVQKTAPLQQTQVLGGQVIRDFAIRGDFSDRVPTVQKQLNNPQPNRVGQRFQALRSLGERLHVAGRFGGFFRSTFAGARF